MNDRGGHRGYITGLASGHRVGITERAPGLHANDDWRIEMSFTSGAMPENASGGGHGGRGRAG